MTTAALCMLISHPDISLIQTSVEAALHTRNFDEILLGVSPNFKRLPEVKALFGSRDVRILPGAACRDEILPARSRLFEQAKSDWLVVIDDDDIMLGSLPLEKAGSRVGMIHGDVMSLCLTDVTGGKYKQGDIFIRYSKTIKNPADSHFFKGSSYAYRREARQEAQRYIRPTDDFDEWRTVWIMLRLGWADLHVPQVIQLQRVRDFSAEVEARKKNGMTSWRDVIREMEKRIPESKG